MTSTPQAIRLVALEQPAGEVELPSGRTVPVRNIDGAGQQLRVAIASGHADERDIWIFARRLVPTATDEEIESLTPTMVGIIADIACGRLEQVLAYAATLEGKPEAPMPTAPSSEPPTGSATS